jgi:hypothetical protein
MHEGVLMTRSRWTGLVLVLVATAYACGSDDKGTRLPDAPIGDARGSDAAFPDDSDSGSGSGSGLDASVCCDPGPGSDAGPGPSSDAGLPHLDAAVRDAGPLHLDAAILDARGSAFPSSH